MTRKRLLIGLVAVLALALSVVVTDLATGFLSGSDDTTATARPEADVVPSTAPGTSASVPAGADTSTEAGADVPVAESAPLAEEQGRYVGTSQDGQFAVAVTIWKSEAIAYVSDGTSREAWLTGTAGGDKLLLTGDDGAVLHGSVAGGVLTGDASQGQWEVTFGVPRAEAPAGLYRASGEIDGADVRFGLIVMPDRSQTGIEWVGGLPKPAPAWSLDGSTVVDKGTEFRVEAIQPGDL